MNLEKLLRGAIKIAAVALTSPATWAVAGRLYTNPLQRIVVQLAALILVEGALLLGWHMLDTNSKATSAQRVLYATMTIIAYFVLWGVAIAHGEGIAGIAFRATLGVVIGYSVFESGILARIKLRRQADRDIMKDWRVKRYAKRLERMDAKERVSQHFELERLQRDVDGVIVRKAVTLDKKERLAAVTSSGVTRKDVTPPKHQNGVTQEDALQQVAEILSVNPDASLREIGEQIDKSHTTVSRYIKQLESENRLPNHNGHS